MTMSPSAACAITIDGVTISPSTWATDPQSQGQESFIGGEASLNETIKCDVALGFGTFFISFVAIMFNFDTTFSITSEQFYTSGCMIKAGLVSGVVFMWNWAATLLQSSNVASNYVFRGPFWYAFGATIQVLLLFGVLTIHLKAVTHSAHTICKIARARLSKTAHLNFLSFGFCLSIIIKFMLLLGGTVTVEVLAGMTYVALPERDQEVLRDAIMNATVQTGRMKTKSEIITMMAQGLMDQGAGMTRIPRNRQVSNADIITKFVYAPRLGYDDLGLVEAIVRHGKSGEHRDDSDIAEMIQTEMEGELEGEGEADEPAGDDFVYNHEGQADAKTKDLLEKYGKNDLPENVPKWRLFLDQFRAPTPIVIWLAIIIQAVITNWIYIGILVVIQFASASISFYELNKAGNAVKTLRNSLKPTAICKRNGKRVVVDAALLVPGDLVLLAAGSAIPADCRVNSSEIDVSQAALTGESLPVTFYRGDNCKMRSTVVRGEVLATVTLTIFGKIASLLAMSGESSHLQMILMKFMIVLVALSLTLCAIVFIYLTVGGLHLSEALSQTVVLLVASIPLAIEIVTNNTIAIGSKTLAKHGAIVARLSAIEDLVGMILCYAKIFIPDSEYVSGHRNTHLKTATAKLKMSALSMTLLTVSFLSVVTAQDAMHPPSPFGRSSTICPRGNANYSVDGYPGSPFLLRLFQQKLSNPPAAKPSHMACRADHHCMISYEFDIVDVQARVFDEVITECQHHPPTWLLTYNRSSPGPSMIAPSGHETLVRFNNKISDRYFNKSHSPCINNGRSGTPTSVHFHGSASLAPFDGWAEDETCRNETKDYVYPNNRPCTGWYHDHALHITADNAYRGLAGFSVVTSKAKLGGCGEPWNLEDIEEKLLMLSDKVLDSECQLYADHEGVHKDDIYGDINLVNGIPFPHLSLDPKWYRFRLLNAATSRAYLWQIRDENGTANIAHTMCKVIAGDGGYRTSPVNVTVDGIIINVAERYEVVCDFRSVAGQTLYMWNHKDDNYMKDIPYFCYSHLIAKIVVGENSDVGALFEENNVSIQPLQPITRVLSEADIQQAMSMINNGTAHREFVFGRSGGQWTINGETWDTMKIAADDVGQNTWELWKFKSGGGWRHPVHVHLVDFYVLQRDDDTAVEGNAGELRTYEQGTPKDTFGLSGGNVWTIARFGAHKGHYMFHCHNLIHEDNDMMRAYNVIHGGKNANSAAKYYVNPLHGLIYNNYEFADPLWSGTAPKPTDQVPSLTFGLVNFTIYANYYRIFYPTEDDLQQYGHYYNPWQSQWCQLPNQAADTVNDPTSTTGPTLKTTSSKPTTRKPNSRKPTSKPNSRKPTSKPNSRKPTLSPTRKPTSSPTRRPALKPTSKPSSHKPTSRPMHEPTSRPTRKPTSLPAH